MRQPTRWAVLAFALLLAALGDSALAQKIYKWVDAEGRVQFTQTPPPEGIKSEQKAFATNTVTDERRRYCSAIRQLAERLAELHNSGVPIAAASDAMRQAEVAENLNADEIALRELVNFVYAAEPGFSSGVAGRAQDACIGGSFGKHGRVSVAARDAAGKPADGAKPEAKEPSKVTGTGWITHGMVATNHHVIDGKNRIRVRFADGREATAFIGETDKVNDVALLRVAGQLPPGLPLAQHEAVIGSDVFTLGYPHTEIMGSNAKLSTGIVNSTTGVQDDPRLYQISVPVQGGNSGGPLLNRDGEVVGLVTSKLSAAQVYKWTGDIPQNVNYAVKVSFLQTLLRRTSATAEDLAVQADSLENHAARIAPSVVLVIAE